MKSRSSDSSGMEGRGGFVRGRTQLAQFDPSRKATGHRLMDFEARETYGNTVLEEATEFGSAILTAGPGAAAAALESRREELGVTVEDAERVLRLPVAAIEADARDLAFEQFEKLAIKLGLDERLLAFDPQAGADRNLGVRLKTLQADIQQGLSTGSVLTFAEAASLARIQNRLARWLELSLLWDKFDRSPDYGDATNPAFKVGYDLASVARERLTLGDSPIRSMRDLVESTLGVPVLQSSLPEQIAGATISDGDDRGVVLNTVGPNRSVWVRRITLAHELGHLLFDPKQAMKSVRVDLYDETDLDPESSSIPDYVEQRANAFAIEFLAPSKAIRDLVKPPFSEEKVAKVMDTYGISVTAARYHISNSYWRQFEVPLPRFGIQPNEGWRGQEDYTLDYFRPEQVPPMRRGRYAGIVAACYQRQLISAETAALYLDCPAAAFEHNAAAIADFYPIG